MRRVNVVGSAPRSREHWNEAQREEAPVKIREGRGRREGGRGSKKIDKERRSSPEAERGFRSWCVGEAARQRARGRKGSQGVGEGARGRAPGSSIGIDNPFESAAIRRWIYHWDYREVANAAGWKDIAARSCGPRWASRLTLRPSRVRTGARRNRHRTRIWTKRAKKKITKIFFFFE